MAYDRGSSDRDYYGENGGRSGDGGGRSGDKRAGGHGKANKRAVPEPYLMRNFFLSEKSCKIHRDVMKIQIRHHLGNSAHSWFGEKDGAYGNFYRAERAFTEAEIEDLERNTYDYTRDPVGFQNSLDRNVWDHSQWTDPNEPSNSAGVSHGRTDSGYGAQSQDHMGSNPRYAPGTGTNYRQDPYESNPNDPYSNSRNQQLDKRYSNTGYDRGAGKASNNYGSHNQRYDGDSRPSGSGYRPGNNYQTDGQTQRGAKDTYAYDSSQMRPGDSEMSTGARDKHPKRFANNQISYSDMQGYSPTGMQTGSSAMQIDDTYSPTYPVGSRAGTGNSYATTYPTGTGTGTGNGNGTGTGTGTGIGSNGYADQFLDNMSPPASYDQQYGTSVSSSTTSDRCVSCRKKAGKCNCAYVSNA